MHSFFAPVTEAFAVTAAETAVVGDGIGSKNGEEYKYNGVNSMVGTLISWNGTNGGYNQHHIANMSSVWVVDNKGEMVNGANSNRCPPINFYSKRNDNLSAIKLIKGINATPDDNTTVEKKPDRYEGETFDNITKGTFNGVEGVNYFTVGGSGASAQQISSDWSKAIFAASLYSNSGILDNEDFGGAKDSNEYEFGWVPDFQSTSGGRYVTKFGTPFNDNLIADNKAGEYNYIAIKLESDWTATDVSGISDVESDAETEPIGVKTHIGRLSNSTADNDTSGDTLIPLGTTFDANYDQHTISDVDTGTVYLNSVLATGNNGVDTTKSQNPRNLATRIKNYATTYNREIRTQQFTFCPAGEGYSFGRLAIPDNAYVILDLNGHKIDRALNNNAANVDTIVQSVFILGQYARLEVFDSSVSEINPYGTGEIKGGVTKNGTGKVFDNQKWDNYGSDSNYANGVKGGGFTLRNRAELTVHSGSVTDNQGLFGGAFYGVGASTVNVFDARVEGNSALRGGMCYLSQGSFMTLNMFGGLVQGNSARMDGFAETNSHGYTRRPAVTDPEAMTDPDIYDEQFRKNPDGYGHEGGGVCVYQESYCNIYGGTITHNYSATFGGGISVSYNSFLKLFGGEITGNVTKGMIRNINGAQIVSESNPKEHEIPKANVGGAGINMYQDSAGIYLNGPAKVTGNYCSQVDPDESYSAEAIAALIDRDTSKEDSNLYLSLTTSMARYSWNSTHYDDSKERYKLTGDWDEEYGPTFKTGGTAAKEGEAVSRKGQMMFNAKQHLYPEIKVQGPLYHDATHVAQVSITPAAGIEAGGYIMRQFYPQGWEDGTDGNKQTSSFNGTNGPRPLKSGEGNTIDESSHAKNQLNSDGNTTFNLRDYLKTGATTGYVDGFLFTDGGTSIVAGTGNDDGWYLALGTRQEGNLPVQWQYYDRTVDTATDKPKGWTEAKTTAETGTGFSLVYNGEDRKYDIRVFVDRTKLTSDMSGVTSDYFYLYYDYYTLANEAGQETELDGDTPKKHRLFVDDNKVATGDYTNILHITSGYDTDYRELTQTDVKYVSERYDRLGYRFTIRSDIKGLKGELGVATPFNAEDKFIANPNYATMKIERATLTISRLSLANINRYYDGTTDFYVPTDEIQVGELTGYAASDQSNLKIQFTNEQNNYVKGTLQSPNVGSTTVSLGVMIEEIGFGEEGSHKNHDANTFPDECLLANYMLYDLNTDTTYPAEDRKEMSVTLNVTVKPKPITVTLDKQTYEYGSIPAFDDKWGTHAGTANWAETYEKANGGNALKELFNPSTPLNPGEVGFSPDSLGLDGRLAQIDIDNEGIDDEHGGTVDRDNLALRLDQILKIMFTSNYALRSSVNMYGGSFSYTNGNYDVTWKFGENEVRGMTDAGAIMPAQIDNLIEITKRKITANIPDAESIYGESQAALSLPDENIKHVSGVGDGLVFGDRLDAVLTLTDPRYVATASNMLRATVDADGNNINDTGYYNIAIADLDAINANYELTAENVTNGKYVVYPRKIVLTARNYDSVYGDPVDSKNMGGYDYTLVESQKNDLEVTSTAVFPTDLAAFGNGISYAYDDAGAHTNAGSYLFNVKFNHALATERGEDIGINYDVSFGPSATHTIAKRRVVVLIASPGDQSSEYGEKPQVTQGTGSGTYWFPQHTTNGKSNDVVLPADMDKFRTGITLYIAEAVNEKAPVGQYPLMCKYDPTVNDNNYEVDFTGIWEGEVDEQYKDPEFGDLTKRAGVYKINRRSITLNVSTTLASEYGDDLEEFWGSGAYTFSREDGKDAIVNDDALTFAPSLFYIQVSASEKVIGGEKNKAFAKNGLHAKAYTVIFDSAAYKQSDEYNRGDNANYEITAIIGRYTVESRKIKVEIGATVDDEFQKDAAIEYGNAVPERTAQVTRLSGKPGGFVGTDGERLFAALAENTSISQYNAGLTPGGHLRASKYDFYVSPGVISSDYDVTFEFGTLTVNQRTVKVRILKQTTSYTGVEPNVDNSKWEVVEGYSLASGDENSIVVLDKTDGVNAGKYDITLSCTDNNYNFVIDENSGENAFVITPAEVDFDIVGGTAIYDALAHRADIIFLGKIMPDRFAIDGKSSTTNKDGSITFSEGGYVYTVTYKYSGEWGTTIKDSKDFVNAGHYTVTVTLISSGTFGVYSTYSGNYCFSFDGSSETAVYTKDVEYDISKATIRIADIPSAPYNRDEQEAGWAFANDVNPGVVPEKSDYTLSSGRVRYAKKEIAGNENARLGGNGLPYYSGKYEFTLTLTDDDAKNFMFGEGAHSETKDFVITALEILPALAQSTAEYDDKSRFHGDLDGGRQGAWSFNFSSTTTTPVDGISYNIEFKYNGLGATGSEKGEHTLTVKVGGYEHSGSYDRAETTYFVDGSPISKERMDAILNDSHAFIDAGTYTYTLTFEYKNFLLLGGSGATESLEYTYTITPVLLSVGAFADKEFNNGEQDADVTEHTFTPTSAMTAEEAYRLLTNDRNGYTLAYSPDTEANYNSLLGANDKPLNAGTYIVEITLTGGNFAFSLNADGSYLYEDRTQRFIITPFDIGTILSTGDLLGVHAFDGELDSEKTDHDEDGILVYTYTYTGLEIMPKLVKATIRLTVDGEPIVYEREEDLAAYFSIGDFQDNVLTDIVSGHHAQLVVTGKGNYTGTTTMAFSIIPMELTAKIGDATSAYGETLKLNSDLISYEDGKVPHPGDDLQYAFTLVGEEQRGGNVIAGKYAIKAECGNLNYKITFKGDWANDDENDGVCGVYEVEKRHILVNIGNQSADYSGKKPTVNTDRGSGWNAVSSYNGTGDAIVGGDENLKITLDIEDETDAWGVKTYVITGTLVEDEIGRNYTVTWETGIFTINAVKITVELKDQTSVYNGLEPSPKQGHEWYNVTSGAAVNGENLDDFIEIYIVNAGTRAMEYQLSGSSANVNYSIDFKPGKYTITPREITVTIEDAESYYGEAEVELGKEYWSAALDDESVGGDAIIAGDDLHIQLRKDTGRSAGKYDINPTWNNDSNYSVTFKSASDPAKQAGTYTIKKRPIVVHINDQTGVYGSISTGTLSQNQGEGEAWYVAGFSAAEDVENGLLTNDPVYEGDRLEITLRRDPIVRPGKYAITGNCANENYAVTFEGEWNVPEGDANNGKAGTYTIEKRKVVITVLPQKGTYGQEKTVSQNQGIAYTVECENATDGIAFVLSDGVSLKFAIDGDVSAVDKYSIYLTITFGVTEHAEWYEITVKENGISMGDGKYEVKEAYEVERRRLTVTISDLNSVYGDPVQTPSHGAIISDNVSGTPILESDRDIIEAEILAKLKLMVKGAPYVSGIIDAGTYDIEGETFISANGNYYITFTGSNGEKGIYTVDKRAITISIQNKQSVYGEIGDYAGDEAEKARVDESLEMTVATSNGHPANVAAVGEDDLGITLYISDPQLSTSKHLKQGKYYIYASYSADEHITENYTFNIVWGEYTVNAREITITLGTENPQSEYGDEITDQRLWGWTAALTFGDGTAVFEEDKIELVMTTTLKKGDDVGNGQITATLTDGDNDNGNYGISWRYGNYSIVQREIVVTVDDIAPVTYGTEWRQPTYTSSRAGGKEGPAILNDEVNVVISVQTTQRSETGYLRWVEGGHYLNAAVTGEKRANYKVEIKNLDVVKYVVQKKNITITIEDATSVYGEDFEDLKWTDTYNGIVKKDGKTDDLDITLRRVNESRNVNDYPIAGTCGNTDYNVTFVGSWNKDDAYKGNCGTYTVTRRVVWIDIIDQKHAVYGETFSVTGPQEGITFNYSDGNVYEIVGGDNAAAIIRFIVKFADGNAWDARQRLDADQYTLTAEGMNGNYEIVVRKDGRFVVNERRIRVTIDDQHGIYGEANNVDQTKYSPQVVNGTGKPIVDGDDIVFTFTSNATKEKANVGTYPINGFAAAQDGTKLGNYIIEYAGSFTGGGSGTYTISKRSIVVTITDQNAIYGGDDGSTNLVPKLDNTLYTASYDGETANAILPGDSDGLAIRFDLKYDESKDLSGAGALKVGTYAIVATYGVGGLHRNYDVVFVGSWMGEENNKTAGTFTVTTRNVIVTIGLDGSLSTSSYGDEPQGPWTQEVTSMYTYALTSGLTGLPIVRGDNIQFTMRTLAEKTSPVGTYPIVGELVGGDNDNDNYGFTFTGGFTAGGGYDEYVGRAGIYTVTPRGIVVQIGSYTREYGEEVNNQEVLSALNDEKTNGVYFTLPEGWSKNGDTVESLGILLDCTADAHSPAQAYTITGSASGGNYEVTFTGGENRYIITQRVIYVVILPQASVYGSPIEVDQKAWYAYRNGKKATWNGGYTVDSGVLAEGDNLDSLYVRLTKRVAIDEYDYNEGSGTYGGQYSIEGDYSNSNYNVIFVGAYTKSFFPDIDAFKNTNNDGYRYLYFTTYDNYDYDEDSAGIREQEHGDSGIYTIAPKSIAITLKGISGTYGGNEYTLDHSMRLKKGVQLDSTGGVVWDYERGSGEIDAGHVGYLSFYLGGKFTEASEACLTPGEYPIVAYWGTELGEKSRVRDWNYAITFYGEWSGSLIGSWTDFEGNTPRTGNAGEFTIENATIEKYGDWYESLEHILEYDTDPYVMSVNNSMTDCDEASRTGKRYLTFKGDITEGKISYGDLYFNANRNSTDGAEFFGTSYDDVDPLTHAPRVNKVGYWILKVTVSADYHNEETFELVYRITPDLIVITLKGDASFEFTYGDYQYDERASEGRPFAALESALKNWLLGEDGLSVVSGMRMNGEDVSETALGNELNELFTNNDVVVSVYKMTGNRSTGGYLNAGRYLITISGGVNLEITFAREYEAVTCTPKTVTATWTMDGAPAGGKHPDDEAADLFTVTYDGRQHPLATTVFGKLDGDQTTGYDVASYRFDGGESGASATPLGYGYYVCRVTSRALGGADGSNYTVEEGLHAYVYVAKRAVTVNIIDKVHHIYGESEEAFGRSDWEVDPSTAMAPGEDKTVLGVVLTRDSGKDVGSYKVEGKYSNENYDVTFKGSWENGTCGTFVIEPRPITVHLIDKTVTYGTELPEGEDLASDITLWYATYDNGIHGIAIIQGDDIHLTMKIQCNDADFTDTKYLKVKSYSVKGGWDNDNYAVSFQSESMYSSAESRYIVEQCRLRVSLFDKYTEYGYDRPEISTAFTGFAPRDEEYFKDNPGTLFIRFFFYDPANGVELLPGANYDPVGIYAVRGEVTGTYDPIGANYDVYFVGSWSDNTYPDLVQQAGVYQVTLRTISIIIKSVTSEYGVIAYVPIELQDGSPRLVGSDTLEGLNIVYKTDAYHDGKTNKPGVYDIKFESIGNPNYRISGAVAIGATYTVKPRNIIITAGDQSGEYGDDHNIESVKGEHWRADWVTESGEKIDGYDGIAYADDAINNLYLLCDISRNSPVGEYALYASYSDPDGCYNIINEQYGQYEIVPREITVWINDYELEYGEDHVANFRMNINNRGSGYYFTREKGGDPIAFQNDPINESYLTLDVTRTGNVGKYLIGFIYDDSNYNVTIKGTWLGEDRKAIGGTYTIIPRVITVTINNQEGEYGDEHTLSQRYGVDWTASRAAGGKAIIGTDDLMLEFSTDAFANSGVGNYGITATCGNGNYQVTVIDGVYKVTPRKLVAKAYGESEYGDPIQDVKLKLTRATEGLDGPGIMSWDEAYLTIDPYFDVDSKSPVGSYPVSYKINGELGENYEIVNEADGEYVIKPREIVVDIDSITQIYGEAARNLTFSVSRAGGKEGEAIIDGEIAIILRVLDFSRNAGEYIIDMQEIENGNYHITVNKGKYTIDKKGITVRIDDQSSEYGSATAALTSGEIEGLVEGDDLGLSLRVEWGDDLAWHNVGEYAIVGTYDNANYLVTFDGTWSVDDKIIGGTYTVYKAKNLWLKEYSGDGTVVQGNGLGEGEAPVAKFGEAVIRYYYDEACTQEIEGDITELAAGIYYAKATVADTSNYSDAETKFAIEVLSNFIYPNGGLDVTLFVCIFASQFLVGIYALLFVRRRKNKKNQSQSEGTK